MKLREQKANHLLAKLPISKRSLWVCWGRSTTRREVTDGAPHGLVAPNFHLSRNRRLGAYRWPVPPPQRGTPKLADPAEALLCFHEHPKNTPGRR